MKKLIDILAPLGITILLVRLAATISGRTLPGQERWHWIAGAALIGLHLVLRFEQIAALVGRRQLRYGGNSLLFGTGALAILVALNWIGYRNNTRWDLTKTKRYSLSEQSRKVLSGLKDDVKLVYFDKASSMGSGEDRLKTWSADSPHIKPEFVDALRNPARAREYGITVAPTVVLEYKGRREKATSDSEQDIANGLIKITREGKKTVCFAEGEGERGFDDSSEKGLSGVRSYLEKSSYATKKITLFGAKEIPADCSVVLLAGPEKDLAPGSLGLLRDLVKAGGRLVVLAEPELKEKQPGVSALLKEWNIEAGPNVIVDLYGEVAGISRLATLGRKYTSHEITRGFKFATVFDMARTLEAGKTPIPDVSAQTLVETSPEAEDVNGMALTWATTDLDLKHLADAQFDAKRDRKGPLPLAAVATIKVAEESKPPIAGSPSPAPVPEDAKPKREGRVVAFGDADFASNGMAGLPGSGNLDLILNSVAWLTQETDLISIRPPEAEDQRLMLNRNQLRLVAFIALLGLPGAFVVMGIGNWWRRR